jgi:hypothetical protein
VVGGPRRLRGVHHLRHPVQCVQPWLPLMTSLLPCFTKWLQVAMWNNCHKNTEVSREIQSKWYSVQVWCMKPMYETQNGVRLYVWCVSQYYHRYYINHGIKNLKLSCSHQKWCNN